MILNPDVHFSNMTMCLVKYSLWKPACGEIIRAMRFSLTSDVQIYVLFLENLWIQPIIFVKNVSIDMRIMALFVYL